MFLFLLIKNIASSNYTTVKIYNFYMDKGEFYNNSRLQLNEKIAKLSLQSTLPYFLTEIKNEEDDIFIKNMKQQLEEYIESNFKYLDKNNIFEEEKKHVLKNLKETSFIEFDAKIRSYTDAKIERDTFQIIAFFDIFIEMLVKSCGKNESKMFKVINFCSILGEINLSKHMTKCEAKFVIENSYTYHFTPSSNLEKLSKKRKKDIDIYSFVKFMFLIFELMNKNLSKLDQGICVFLEDIENAFRKLNTCLNCITVHDITVIVSTLSDKEMLIFSYYTYKYNQTKLDFFSYKKVFITLANSFQSIFVLDVKEEKQNLKEKKRNLQEKKQNKPIKRDFDEISCVISKIKIEIGKILSEAEFHYEKKLENGNPNPIQDFNADNITKCNQITEKGEINFTAPIKETEHKSEPNFESETIKLKDNLLGCKDGENADKNKISCIEKSVSHGKDAENVVNTQIFVNGNPNPSIKTGIREDETEINKSKMHIRKEKPINSDNIVSKEMTDENKRTSNDYGKSTLVTTNIHDLSEDKKKSCGNNKNSTDEPILAINQPDNNYTRSIEGGKNVVKGEFELEPTKSVPNSCNFQDNKPVYLYHQNPSTSSNQVKNTIQNNKSSSEENNDLSTSFQDGSSQNMSKLGLEKSLTNSNDEDEHYNLFLKALNEVFLISNNI